MVLAQFVRKHAPLIKFLGPRHLLPHASLPPVAPSKVAASAAAPGAASAQVSAFEGMPKRGSPPISPEEADALLMGGADRTWAF